ncbi:hypothetical protein [Tamlana flava]|uniref:hypothetical protein n=1 Tax=Tamlana flava TaxID=3158572 RepID=UPI00351B57E2
MKSTISFFLLIGLLMTSIGCSSELETTTPTAKISNQELIQYLTKVSSSNGLASKSNNAENSKLDEPPIWGDCILYSGLVVPATFKPTSGNFDELYVMPEAMFYGGIPLISDSKPGDKDYNGGRWHLNVLKAGVDPTKYSEACSVESLNVTDFHSTDMYFECPMRPRKN